MTQKALDRKVLKLRSRQQKGYKIVCYYDETHSEIADRVMGCDGQVWFATAGKNDWRPAVDIKIARPDKPAAKKPWKPTKTKLLGKSVRNRCPEFYTDAEYDAWCEYANAFD